MRCALVILMCLGLSACSSKSISQNFAVCQSVYLDDIGLPKPTDGTGRYQIPHEHYLLSYNANTLLADWVVECINRDETKGDATQNDAPKFSPDPHLEDLNLIAVTNYDYTQNEVEYERGHLAAAGNYAFSQDILDETMVTTNMVPQLRAFNRGIWLTLENYTRDLAQQFGTVIVITGPVVSSTQPNTPKQNTICALTKMPNISTKNEACTPIAIPTAYYKIIYEPTSQIALSFLLPHIDLKGNSYFAHTTTLEEIETLTGLNFFPKLD